MTYWILLVCTAAAAAGGAGLALWGLCRYGRARGGADGFGSRPPLPGRDIPEDAESAEERRAREWLALMNYSGAKGVRA